jgi:hypothetical protein
MEDPKVNILLILELQMTHKSLSNNHKSEGFGIKRSKADMIRVLVESTKVFA